MARALTLTSSYQVSWNYTDPQAGFNATGNTSGMSKNMQMNSSDSGEPNRIYSTIVNVAPSSSTTLDLTSISDDQLNLSIAFTDVKVLAMHLLSEDDSAEYGTSCDSVVIGNNTLTPALANTSLGLYVGTGAGERIFNGGFSVKGNLTASPVSASYKNLVITNEDSTTTAALMLSVAGAG